MKPIAYAVTLTNPGASDGATTLRTSADGGLSWSSHGLFVPNVLTVSYGGGRFYFLTGGPLGDGQTRIYMSDGPAGEVKFQGIAPGSGTPYNVRWGIDFLGYINGAWVYVDAGSLQYYVCYSLFTPSPVWQPLWGGVSSPLIAASGPFSIAADDKSMYVLLTTGFERTTNGGDRWAIGYPPGITHDDYLRNAAIIDGKLYVISGSGNKYSVFSPDTGAWSTHTVVTGTIGGISSLAGRPTAFGAPPTHQNLFFLDVDQTCAAPKTYTSPSIMNTAIDLGGCVIGDTNWDTGYGTVASSDSGFTWNWLDNTYPPGFVSTSIATNYKYSFKFWTQKINTTE